MDSEDDTVGRRFFPISPAFGGRTTGAPRARARHARRTLAALAVAVLVAALGAAVVSRAQAHRKLGDGRPRGAAAAGSIPRFEPGACPRTPEPIAELGKSRCGALVVPEDHARPDGRTIRLSVVIVPARAKSPKPDPVVFMTGGPGEAAVHVIPFLVAAGVNRDRDLIVMGQRGTLYDKPDLNCRELDRFYGRQVGLRWDAPSTGRAQAAAAARVS